MPIVDAMKLRLSALRRTLLAAAVVLGCWSGIAAAQTVDLAPASWSPAPVTVGSNAAQTFTVTNNTGATVTVTSLVFGPGTAATFSLGGAAGTPFDLVAGGTATVQVTFTPTAGGAAAGSLEVVTTGGDGMAALTGTGRITGLDLSATTLDFGSVAVGASATQSVTLTNSGASSVSLNGVSLDATTSPAFTLPGAPAPLVLAPGAFTTVSVQLAPASGGDVGGALSLATSAGTLSVLLDGSGVAAATVSPDELFFGNTLVGTTPSFAVTIGNPGPNSLQVDSLTLGPATSPSFSLVSPPSTPLTVAPGGSVGVSVQFAPGDVSVARGSLDVRANGGSTPAASVPLTGQGVASAYRVHPLELAFGSLAMGTSSTRTVQIANAGTGPLTLTGLALGAGTSTEFALVSPPATPLTLAAGAVQTVQVRYTPALAAAAAGTLSITTSAGPATVAFSGRSAYALTFLTSNVRVGAGLQCPGCQRVGLASGATAPAGGLAVTVTSTDPSRLLVAPSSIPMAGGAASVALTIPAGSNGVDSSVLGIEGTSGGVTLALTAPGAVGATTTVTVAPAAVTLASLTTPQTGGGADSVFYVRVGALKTDGVTLDPQPLRRGGPATVTATVTSSDGTVGQLVTSAGAAASRSVQLIAASLQSAGTVAGGGIAFRPLPAGGTTTVSATIPGFTTLATASQAVTVTSSTPTLSVTLGTLTRIGAGLEAVGGTVTSSVAAPSPAGLSVTLTSNDATRLFVAASPIPASGGASTVTLTIPAGSTSVGFGVQGLATGSTTVTASATGYTSGTSAAITIETPLVTLINLASSQTAGGASDDFQVRVGLGTTSGSTTFGSAQSARQGGGGLTATVTTSNAAAGTLVTSGGSGITGTAGIAAGQSDSPATVAAGGIAFAPDPGVTGTQSTTVSASVPGFGASTTASQTVNVTSGQTLTVSLGTLTRIGAGLEAVGGTVTSSAPAPSPGGLAVTLTSSDATRLLVAASPIPASGGAASLGLTIPAGATSVAFGVQGLAAGTATLTASATAYNPGTSAAVSVETPLVTLLNLASSQTSTGANDDFQARVGLATTAGGTTFGAAQNLRQGGPASVTATVTTSNATAGTLTTSGGSGTTRTVTIAAGTSDSPATVPAGGVTFDPNDSAPSTQTTTVGATIPGFTASTTASQVLTVSTPSGLTLLVSGNGTRVGAGLQCAGCFRVSLANGATASAPGLAVTITSQDSSRVLVTPSTVPSSGGTASVVVTIPTGSNSVGFSALALETAAGSTVTLDATAAGANPGSAQVNVVAPAVMLASLTSPQTGGGADSPFLVRVGALRADGISLDIQNTRLGGAASVTATVTSSDGTAGQIVTSSGASASRTVAILAGFVQSAGTVASGGVAFRPLPAGGTTTVSATIPGFISIPAATQTVSVTSATPALSVSLGTLTRIGAGLEVVGGTVTSTVPAPSPGGLAVTLISNDASRLLVAPSPIPAGGGASAITLTIPAGGTSVGFGLQGLAAGTTTVTASAAGSTPGTSASISIETPVLTLLNLNSSLLPTSPNNDFQVRVGLPTTAGGTAFGSAQNARQGGSALTATVTTSNAAAGTLVTTGGSGTTETVSIAPGTSDSPATAATGGIAFSPSSAVTTSTSTVVSAAIPGFAATATSSQTVTVAPPVQTLSVSLGTLTRIGAGLEVSSCCTVTSNVPAPSPGGLAVTLSSNDATRLLVAASPIPAGGGAASIGVTIPAGATSAGFSLQGLAAGSTTVTASAAGYASGTSSAVSIETPLLTLLNVVPSQQATGANNDFQVRVGLATTAGSTTFATPQNVRQGGGAVTATVTSSNAGAGTLATNGGNSTSQTVSIAAGASDSPVTAAAGGIAFDPNNTATGTQTTTVAASIPGFTASTTASVTVTVSSTQSMVLRLFGFGNNTFRLAAGLEANYAGQVQLLNGAVAPAGGLTVTITSDDPSTVLVESPIGWPRVPLPAITLTIPAGATTSPQFHFQAFENTQGRTLTLTASAPGYAPASTPVIIVDPVVQLLQVPPTVSASAGPQFYNVYIGATYAGGGPIQNGQTLRYGSPFAFATFTVVGSDGTILQSVTSNGQATTQTITMPQGHFVTPSVFVDGPERGIAAQGIAPGTATLSVSGMNYVTYPAYATRTVTVTP